MTHETDLKLNAIKKLLDMHSEIPIGKKAALAQGSFDQTKNKGWGSVVYLENGRIKGYTYTTKVNKPEDMVKKAVNHFKKVPSYLVVDFKDFSIVLDGDPENILKNKIELDWQDFLDA